MEPTFSLLSVVRGAVRFACTLKWQRSAVADDRAACRIRRLPVPADCELVKTALHPVIGFCMEDPQPTTLPADPSPAGLPASYPRVSTLPRSSVENSFLCSAEELERKLPINPTAWLDRPRLE